MLRPGYFRVPWHVLDFAWRLRWWRVMFLDGGFFQCPNIKVLRFWSPGLIRIFEEIQFWWADLIEMRSFPAKKRFFSKVFLGTWKHHAASTSGKLHVFFPHGDWGDLLGRPHLCHGWIFCPWTSVGWFKISLWISWIMWTECKMLRQS